MTVDTVIAGVNVGDAYPARIMGVINVSPESFYKESVIGLGSVVSKAEQMIAEGAEFLDIGGRSTWPLADKITKKEERRRLMPALELLLDNTNVPVSVDTQFADLAEEALDMGAHIINDVSGLLNDPHMIDVVIEKGCPVVVMASCKVPGDPLGMDSILESLEMIIHRAEDGCIASDQIIIDPAIGRWTPKKVSQYDFETIGQMERLKVLNKPILAAISRKSFIGEVLDKPPDERLVGSIAATAIAVYNGVHIIRTHDVTDTFDAVKVAESIVKKKNTIKTDLSYW